MPTKSKKAQTTAKVPSSSLEKTFERLTSDCPDDTIDIDMLAGASSFLIVDDEDDEDESESTVATAEPVKSKAASKSKTGQDNKAVQANTSNKATKTTKAKSASKSKAAKAITSKANAKSKTDTNADADTDTEVDSTPTQAKAKVKAQAKTKSKDKAASKADTKVDSTPTDDAVSNQYENDDLAGLEFDDNNEKPQNNSQTNNSAQDLPQDLPEHKWIENILQAVINQNTSNLTGAGTESQAYKVLRESKSLGRNAKEQKALLEAQKLFDVRKIRIIGLTLGQIRKLATLSDKDELLPTRIIIHGGASITSVEGLKNCEIDFCYDQDYEFYVTEINQRTNRRFNFKRTNLSSRANTTGSPAPNLEPMPSEDEEGGSDHGTDRFDWGN